MRRFWAYITLALTALLLMGTTFFSLFTKMTFNQQYTEGSEITYRLTDIDDPNAEITDPNASKDIASIMKTRLDTIGITEYNIKTVGNDVVKVQFSEPNNLNKNNIVAYLGFNGSLALSNMDDNENYLHITGSEFLLSGSKAYLDSINNYPTIVIPINKDSSSYQDLISKTEAQKEAGIGEKTSTTDENGESVEKTTTYLYLWYDFNEDTDRYSKTDSSSSDYDINVARKIIMKFNIEDAYYPDNQNNKLAASINLDTDGSQSITTTEVRNGYNNARFYVNLLNSEVLDYKVTQINDQQVKFIPATVESLVTNSDPHQYVAWNRTLIATLCIIALVTLISVVFFKWSSVAIVTTSLLSLFAAIGFTVFMTAEFNIGAIIALAAVGLATLASSIYYASKLKDECYRGRTLKKANSEAARKTLLPTVDMFVAVVIIGIFSYLFGGSLMRTFALISVVGGIVGLLISLIWFRIMMWLVTNNTAFASKYRLFGVDEDKLPKVKEDNESKTEVYKGEYENVNFNRRAKPIGIVACLLFVASLAGLITFGVINNNQPLASSKEANSSQLYVYSTNELLTLDSVQNDLLDQVTIYVNDTQTKPLTSYVKNSATYSHTENVDGVDVTTYYFEYNLSGDLNETTVAQANFLVGSPKQALKEVLNEFNGVDDKTTASVKVMSAYSRSAADFAGITLGTSVALLVLGLYFVLRYKLSRGVTTLLLSFAFSAIGFGIFSLTRIAFPTVTSVVIPLIALFALILSIFIMSREKDIVIEDKAREIDYSRRCEMMQKATSLSMNEIIVFSLASCFMGVFFFGFGPSATRLLFVLLTAAFIIVTVLVVALYGPVAQKLYKWFSPVENKRRKKKRKENKNIVSATHRSKEPEEAIFIGIND